MKTYVTTAIVAIAAGTIIGLDADQARARSHALKTLRPAGNGRGVYEALTPLQFKIGETIELDAELSRAQATELIDEKEAARRAKEAEKNAKPGKLSKEALAAMRADIEAELRPVVEGEVYARLLALLSPELKAAVEEAVANSAASETQPS